MQFLVLATLIIVPFLNSGKSNTSDIFLFSTSALLGIVWIAKLIKGSNYLLPRPILPLFVIHFTYIIFVTLSTVDSVSIIQSIPEWQFQVAVFSFVWLGLPYFTARDSIPRLLLSLSVTGAGLSLISLFMMFLKQPVFPGSDINFFYPVYGHNRLAEYLVLTIPLSCYFLFVEKGRAAYRMVFVVQLIALIFSFSRGALLVAFIGPFILSFLSQKKYKPRPLIIFTLLLLIPLSLVMVREFNFTSPSKEKIAQLTTKPPHLVERLEFVYFAIKRIIRKPLLGYGPATFQFIPDNNMARPSGSTIYTHNFILQTAYEKGIIATALLIVIFISVVFSFLRKRQENKSNAIKHFILTAVILSLLHAQLDFDWEIPAIFATVIFLIFISQLVGRKKLVKTPLSYFVIPLSFIPIASGMILPKLSLLSRKHYQDVLAASGQNLQSPDRDKLLSDWTRVDGGNGQMYLWLSRQSFMRGNYQLAAEELILSRKSIFNNGNVGMDQITEILEKFLEAKVDEITAWELIDIVFRAYHPHDLYWLSQKEREIVFLSIDKLLSSDYFHQISPRNISEINYLKFTQNLIGDMRLFEEYHQFILHAIGSDPTNTYYQDLAFANKALVDKDLSRIIQATVRLRLRMAGPETPDVVKSLLSYLLEASVDNQEVKIPFQNEVKIRQEAIDLSPGYGSLYIDLAIRLRQFGRSSEADEVIAQCQKIHKNCPQWYQGSADR